MEKKKASKIKSIFLCDGTAPPLTKCNAKLPLFLQTIIGNYAKLFFRVMSAVQRIQTRVAANSSPICARPGKELVMIVSIFQHKPKVSVSMVRAGD